MDRPSTARDEDAIEIRRVRAGEWKEHRALRLKALARDPLAFGSTHAREVAFPDDLWKERTSRNADSEQSALFVADAGEGGLVGMVAIAFLEQRWHVFAMWVAPEYRRRGLGGRLLDVGVTWFRQQSSVDALLLEVNPRQQGAVQLYERAGFHRTGGESPLGHTPGEVTISMALEPEGTSAAQGPTARVQ